MSRSAGTAAWVTATEAISVGAMNSPLRISSPAVGSTCVDERQRQQRQRQQHRSDPEPLGRSGLPGDGAGDHSGDQRAAGPGHHDDAGVRQDARFVGEGDDDDLHAAEQHAQGRAGEHDRHQQAADSLLARLRRSARLARGGWVPRWAASTKAPTRPTAPPAASPRAGWIAVARKVASTGPTMKTTSSSTASQAKAVFSSGVPRSRWLQRARTRGTGGGEAEPHADRGDQGHRERGVQQHAW